jgi:hypothetical protein
MPVINIGAPALFCPCRDSPHSPRARGEKEETEAYVVFSPRLIGEAGGGSGAKDVTEAYVVFSPSP